MVDFGPNNIFSSNVQIAISQEPLGVRSWSFPSFNVLMRPTNSAKRETFWEISIWLIESLLQL